jgi:hypothetical protein
MLTEGYYNKPEFWGKYIDTIKYKEGRIKTIWQFLCLQMRKCVYRSSVAVTVLQLTAKGITL